MKFDKETAIAIAICVVILFGWDPFCRYMGWIPDPAVPAAQTAPAAAPATVSTPSPAAPSPAVQEPAAPAVRPAEPVLAAKPLPPVELKNADMTLRINPLDGSVSGITMNHYLNAGQTAPVTLDHTLGQHTGALSLFEPGSPWVVTGVLSSRPTADSYELEGRIRTASGTTFDLLQKWQIASSGYETQISLEVKNRSGVPLSFSNLVFNGGDLAPWALISGDKVRVASHRMDYMTAAGKFFDIKAGWDDEDFFQNPAPTVSWAGIGNKYFTVLLTAAEPYTLYQARTFRLRGQEKDEIITVGARLAPFVVGAGDSKQFAFRYYSGPKEIAQLDAFDTTTGRVMHLAWGPLDYLARLLLWILVKLHGLCGSYGVSIIILTLLVRLLFYPVTAKANASMKKMQAVQPKIQELREKYKDNPQLLNTKMMELYRTEKVNPFGGCLPILLQIPVFFALYATLDGAVELRQVPFLWSHDLAAADTVARIPLFLFGWSLPINPLVIAMTVLMVIQQRMTPMSMDPVQKKMMMAMPIVMLIFLYDLPSGLTLYWTVSNIFSIIQLRLQQRSGNVQCAAPVKDAR